MGEMDKYAIPDAPGAVMLDERIASLRKEISGDCSALLRQARSLGARGMGNFSIKLWENRVSLIMEQSSETFSIEELESLLKECRELSRNLHRFG